MFQSAFPTRTRQPCSWCHTNALIKLRLILQFSSSPASSSLPYPLLLLLSLPVLNLFNPRPYPNCYRWTEGSKTFNPTVWTALLQGHMLNWILTRNLEMCSWKAQEAVLFHGSPVSEEASRLEDVAAVKAWSHSTHADVVALSNANTHTQRKPVFFSTRQSISARLTSLPS